MSLLCPEMVFSITVTGPNDSVCQMLFFKALVLTLHDCGIAFPLAFQSFFIASQVSYHLAGPLLAFLKMALMNDLIKGCLRQMS